MPTPRSDEIRAQFSDEWVERDARLFQAGEYPDRDFSADEGDLDAMVAATQAGERVPVYVEHHERFMDLGDVVTDSLRRVGDWIVGRVKMPRAINDAILTGGVSVRIDRATKRIRELSLTPTPRVAGAALMSWESGDHIVFTGGSLMPEDVEVTTAEQPAPEAPVETVVDEDAERGLNVLQRIGAMFSRGGAPENAGQPDPADDVEARIEAAIEAATAPLQSRIDTLESTAAGVQERFSQQWVDDAVRQRVTPRHARLLACLRTGADELTFSDGDESVTLSREAAADELLLALAGTVPGADQIDASDGNEDVEFSVKSARLAEKLRREQPELSLSEAQERADQMVVSGQEV